VLNSRLHVMAVLMGRQARYPCYGPAATFTQASPRQQGAEPQQVGTVRGWDDTAAGAVVVAGARYERRLWAGARSAL
jgi:hypothetical protein